MLVVDPVLFRDSSSLCLPRFLAGRLRKKDKEQGVVWLCVYVYRCLCKWWLFVVGSVRVIII